MSVMYVRLVTGEELIGDYDTETGMIKDPALIAVGANPLNNQMKVQLVPWAMFGQDSLIPLNKDHVMFAVAPEEQLYNRYNQAFGSGIQIPAGSGKVLI